MKFIRKKVNGLAASVATLMVLMAVPYQSVLAAMIPTEAAINSTKGQEARDYLDRLISREDVRNYLIAQGINPVEAKARVNILSDAEAVKVAEQIDHLPAGGSAVGAIVGAALIVFLVLLVTDLLGLTDVFPFVKKHK